LALVGTRHDCDRVLRNKAASSPNAQASSTAVSLTAALAEHHAMPDGEQKTAIATTRRCES
jgi:hypothetical protein